MAQDSAARAKDSAKAEGAKQSRQKSVSERLMRVHAKGSLKPNEHIEDLVLYRNISPQKQVIEDDQGSRIMLLPMSYTDKSQRLFEEGKIQSEERIKFDGGTIILTRRRGLPLVATNVLEEVEVVDKANPADYD